MLITEFIRREEDGRVCSRLDGRQQQQQQRLGRGRRLFSL